VTRRYCKKFRHCSRTKDPRRGFFRDQAWNYRRTRRRLRRDSWPAAGLATPDGRRLVFASQRGGGVYNLWWQAADGTGGAERLTTNPTTQWPTSISPDGHDVVFFENTTVRRFDLLRVVLPGTQYRPCFKRHSPRRTARYRWTDAGSRTSRTARAATKSTFGRFRTSRPANGSSRRAAERCPRGAPTSCSSSMRRAHSRACHSRRGVPPGTLVSRRSCSMLDTSRARLRQSREPTTSRQTVSDS
jgi:WD40-like Beta Propeller Repeat